MNEQVSVENEPRAQVWAGGLLVGAEDGRSIETAGLTAAQTTRLAKGVREVLGHLSKVESQRLAAALGPTVADMMSEAVAHRDRVRLGYRDDR